MHLDTPSLRGCFITGTDTDAGKTTVTAALLRALHVLNCPARAIKPVQTGCEPDAAGRLRAPDALRYAEAAGIEDDMNQTLRSFLPACSPHLAAELAGTPLDAASLAADCRAACGEGVTLFEGAGGLFVPLNRHETMLDLMARLRMPVLLVAGNRLGCINHALLSLNALQDRGLSVIGMVLCRTAPTNGEMSSGSADEQAFETRLLRDNAATLAEFGRAARRSSAGRTAIPEGSEPPLFRQGATGERNDGSGMANAGGAAVARSPSAAGENVPEVHVENALRTFSPIIPGKRHFGGRGEIIAGF